MDALRSSRAAREQAGAFASHLTLNASMFAVLFYTSLRLHPSEFARLSIANTSVAQLGTLLTLGLDYGALKLSFEGKSSSFIALNLFIKAVVFLFALFLFLIWTGLVGFRSELVVFVAAAGVAFWASAVTVTQYERRFVRFAALNVTLAALRLTTGIAAASVQNWVLIILALYVVAQLPIHLLTLGQSLRELRSAARWADLPQLLILSPQMLAAGTLFSILPLITQGLLFARSGSLATSAFGVVLIFTTPLHTLIATLHIYLLPQVLSRDIHEVNVFGLGRGSMNLLAFGFAFVFLLITAPVALGLEWIYGARLPLVSPLFVVYFSSAVITLALGLHNLRAQRWMLVRIALAVNFCRAGATALLGVSPAIGPFAIVAWSSAIMLAGEVTLWLLLKRAEKVGTTAPSQH